MDVLNPYQLLLKSIVSDAICMVDLDLLDLLMLVPSARSKHFLYLPHFANGGPLLHFNESHIDSQIK